LDIEEDVYSAVRELAEQRGQTAGKVVSDLIRSALRPKESAPEFRNGVRLLPINPSGPIVTMGLVNRLRDEE
jgi:hypothetical protein